jgi:cobalamin biosynthesis protein CobD/CbiB
VRRPDLPTGDQSETVRILRAITHPTQVIRRVEQRVAERSPEAVDRLSGILLVSAAVGASTGLVLAVTGILIRVPSMFLLGAILVAGGMAAASLEGLLEPETELIARIRKLVNR